MSTSIAPTWSTDTHPVPPGDQLYRTPCGEAVAPPRPAAYAFGFAEGEDAPGVAYVLSAAGGAELWTPDEVRGVMHRGEVEFLIARHRRAIVALVALAVVPREGRQVRARLIALPGHRYAGLERYLSHLAGVWEGAMTAGIEGSEGAIPQGSEGTT